MDYVRVGVGILLRSIDHMLLIWSLLPLKDCDGTVMCSMMSASDVNMALYPLSQNCAMDNRALLRMSRDKWQQRAAMGMCGMSSSAVYVTSINMLLRNLTVTPGAHRSMFMQWTSI